MPADVVVIGDALLDVHVRPAIPPRAGADVPAAIRLGTGGQGANVAVRLARRGVAVRLACAIGADAAGRIVREALAADGVELHDLGASRTGSVVVLLDPGGERTMLSHRSSILESRVPPPDLGPLLEGRWLVVSGYVLLEPAAGLSATGDRPLRAVLGCAMDARQVNDWVAAATSLAPHLVILNLDEARAIAGTGGDPVTLAAAVAERFGAVVITTHAGGAAASIGGRTVTVDAAPQAAVDTTGAGDAFAAALLAESTAGTWPPDDAALAAAIRAGVALAGAVACVEGAQARVPGEGGGAAA